MTPNTRIAQSLQCEARIAARAAAFSTPCWHFREDAACRHRVDFGNRRTMGRGAARSSDCSGTSTCRLNRYPPRALRSASLTQRCPSSAGWPSERSTTSGRSKDCLPGFISTMPRSFIRRHRAGAASNTASRSTTDRFERPALSFCASTSRDVQAFASVCGVARSIYCCRFSCSMPYAQCRHLAII